MKKQILPFIFIFPFFISCAKSPRAVSGKSEVSENYSKLSSDELLEKAKELLKESEDELKKAEKAEKDSEKKDLEWKDIEKQLEKMDPEGS